MDQQTKTVFNGYLNLSAEQRSDLIDVINDFNHKDAVKRQELKKAFSESERKVHLGPTRGNCPCCGR